MPVEIGLTMNYHFSADNIERAYLDHSYFDFLAEQNVLCRPIFPVDCDQKMGQYLETVSGIIFTGGLDLDMSQWQVPLHPKAQLVHKRRQEFELRLLKLAISRKIPILGICLGMQLINAALGGQIHQHLPERARTIDHGYDGKKTRHNIKLNPKSKLYQWLKVESCEVPSAHHQGIVSTGKGLIAAGIANDGIVEAVEMSDYPFLMAVQWHPEKEADSEISKKLIGSFIQKASEYTTSDFPGRF